jgi:eukaryotic-like serine/threonine-protein kinase
MIGRTLSHYRVTARIGAGGMGEVYQARDERLERDVALKVLPAKSLDDATARKRFRKEALALSKLNHPGIATIYDFNVADGVDFLAMEFVVGETLARTARECTPAWVTKTSGAVTDGEGPKHQAASSAALTAYAKQFDRLDQRIDIAVGAANVDGVVVDHRRSENGTYRH